MKELPFRHLTGGAIALILLLVAGCGRSPQPEAQTPIPAPSEAPELVYRDINLTETDNDGNVLWKLEADIAEYEQDGFQASLQTVEGEFYDPEGKAITVSAEGGRVLPREKRLELSGTVEAVAEPLSLALSADKIEWRPEDNKLAAIGNVIVRQTERQIEMKGDRLDADLSTNYLRLSLDPPDTSTSEPDASAPDEAAAEPPAIVITSVDPPLDVTTQIVEWDTVTDVVRSSGGVVITHREQEVTFRGKSLTYELASQTATLEGEVKAVAIDRAELEADRVQWDVNEELAIATGNVFYKQSGAENLTVRGQKGTADLRTNTIALEGAGSQVTTQFTLP
ncbi:MAG: LPS export ABC transporter periplasmic protein LptC [Cyanobacteria bacterium J06639_1]